MASILASEYTGTVKSASDKVLAALALAGEGSTDGTDSTLDLSPADDLQSLVGRHALAVLSLPKAGPASAEGASLPSQGGPSPAQQISSDGLLRGLLSIQVGPARPPSPPCTLPAAASRAATPPCLVGWHI